MSVLGKVNSIVRLRINSDGEGVRSVIFLQDCPLSCIWCCNPETRFGNRYKEISPEQLYELIVRDQIYFDATKGGVTFSGGEPLVQADYIVEFMKSYGHLFNCNIETSLFSSFDAIEKLIPFINEWYIDFKVSDEKKHLEYTKVSNDRIKKNLEKLVQIIAPEKIIVTYPVIPGFNDSSENVEQMICFMDRHKLHKIELHPYRKYREKKNERMGLEYEPIEVLSTAVLARIENRFLQSGMEIVKRNIIVERKKCDTLKSIRRVFCEENNIPVVIEECSYRGRCAGTCPKCEEELDDINRWREKQN